MIKLISKSIAAVALMMSISCVALAANADAVAGQEKSKTCAACHGPTGNETIDGQYPLLAGQYADYMVKSLKDYRDGKRSNPIMLGLAATLSDQDIADISAFYAEQKTSKLDDLSHVK